MSRVVAVITPYHRLFQSWLLENKEEGNEYFCANNVASLIGRKIDAVEFGTRHEEVGDEVYRCVMLKMHGV